MKTLSLKRGLKKTFIRICKNMTQAEIRKEYTQMTTDLKKLKGIPQKFRQVCCPEGCGVLVGFSTYDLINIVEAGWKKTVIHCTADISGVICRVTVNGHHYRHRLLYKALMMAVLGEWGTHNQVAIDKRFKKW